MQLSKWIFRLLQWAAIAVLIGRAYQHWFWDAPYRAVLWDEDWMRPLIEGLFGLSWADYVGDIRIDRAIQTGIKVVGSALGLGAVIAAFPRFFPRRAWNVLPILSGWLVFLALLYSKEQDFRTGLLIEYALQAAAPLLFFYYLKRPEITTGLEKFIRLAIALTFIGHGLYAIGYYPRPGNFSTMVINSLGVSLDTANSIIWVAGLLDFIVALWLLLPIPWRKVPLAYCVIWGFLTAFARIWAYFYPEFWMDSLHQWTLEFVYRMPHFLIPLVLLLEYKRMQHRTTSP